MTRARLAALGRSLGKEDEVVIEATGNAMAVVRVLSPYVGRVIVANPLQVKAIAHAHVKTDKIDAGVLASLRAADFLPEIWLPDADTERRRRLVARRNQVVRHRTRIKNEVHAILHAHLVPPCPHAELFGRLGRIWLSRQIIPDDEAAAIDRHLREVDRSSLEKISIRTNSNILISKLIFDRPSWRVEVLELRRRLSCAARTFYQWVVHGVDPEFLLWLPPPGLTARPPGDGRPHIPAGRGPKPRLATFAPLLRSPA